jgi:hypothetical protein
MKTTPFPPTPHQPSEVEIQQQAYHLWIDGGCLEGVELDNWLTAKELLRHRHGHAHGHAIRGAHPQAVSGRKARA